MQYILTQEELNALKNRADENLAASKETLQKLCTMVADHMPIKVSWAIDGEPPYPWGCILSDPHGNHCCGECPVQKMCPHPSKEWSQ